MPTTTQAPPVRGAPCWVNLLVRDPLAARAFYTAVLGWEFDDSGPLGEGFYGEVFSWPSPGPDGIDVAYEEERIVARVAGRPVAVLSGGGVESAPDPAVRPRWAVHFAVDDVPRAAEKAVRAGGAVFPAPGPVSSAPLAEAGIGTRAAEYVVRDPEGALFTVSSR
ncbi:VOC family protein [Kitasatospora albolonga]